MAAHVVLDMEIEHLLEDLADKEDALVAALQDREAYQLLARVALGRVAELMIQNARLRECVHRSLDEKYGTGLSNSPGEVGAAA